jgi:hypothetical protein
VHLLLGHCSRCTFAQGRQTHQTVLKQYSHVCLSALAAVWSANASAAESQSPMQQCPTLLLSHHTLGCGHAVGRSQYPLGCSLPPPPPAGSTPLVLPDTKASPAAVALIHSAAAAHCCSHGICCPLLPTCTWQLGPIVAIMAASDLSWCLQTEYKMQDHERLRGFCSSAV